MAINKTYMKLLRLGITPNHALGAHKDSQTMFVVHVEDGIEYAIDDLGYFEETGDSEAVIGSIENLELVLDRHHDLVVKLKDHFQKKLKRNVWVTANAGMQVSITLGDFNGAFADVMLSFTSQKALEECKEHIREMGIVEDEEELNHQLSLYLMVILDPDYKKYSIGLSHPNLIIKSLDDEDFGFEEDEDGDDD